MENPASAVGKWLREDLYRTGLLFGGFLVGIFLIQGLPYWDDDFASILTPNRGRSLLQLFGEWLSPIYAGSKTFGSSDRWGFTDRPVQFIVYKISYLISGYASWPYLLFKSACYAGLGVMIYSWALRLVPQGQHGRRAAFAAAVFFLVSPGPVASLVFLADFAPAAELAFLILTFIIWKQIEETPVEWVSLSPLSSPEKRKWLWTWIGLVFAVYLSYKTKPDLKLIPIILGAYILLVRRRQWRLFAIPVGLMLALAVPWHRGIFTERPPFLPGSSPNAVGFMWQPAKLSTLREFIWSSAPYDFMRSLKGDTFSLAGLLGPFLLSAIVVFIVWRTRALSSIDWKALETQRARASLFVLLWLGTILAGMSSLAELSTFFSVRHGILMLVPASILMSWVFGQFVTSYPNLPRWATVACIALFAAQAGINLNRSVSHRRDLGTVMKEVNQAYTYIDEKFTNDELALAPGQLSYNYRSNAGKAIRERDLLGSLDDLAYRHTPNKTLVLSRFPSHWEQLDFVANFTNCNPISLFERIFSCAAERKWYLTRYIGTDSAFQAAEAAQAKGDLAEARKGYEAILIRHPANLGVRFNLGLVMFQQKNWTEAERAYSSLEEELPNDTMVLYNHALVMIETKQIDPAIVRLRRVVEMLPLNYGARFNLARAYTLEGNQQLAEATMREWNQLPKPAAPPVDPLTTAAELAKRVPTPENYLNLSLQYYQKQRFQDAISAAREALKLKPDFAEAENNIAASFNNLAMWDDAIVAGKEAIRINPNYQLAKNNLALALSQKEKAIESLTVLAAEVRRNPTPEKYLTLSLQYNRLRQYQASIAACKEALKLRPDYAEAYNNIAAANEAIENWDAAVEAARRALSLKPDFQLARNNLEYSIRRQKAKVVSSAR